MKQWVGYVLLALSLVVAYQGWANVSKVSETEGMAKAVACDVDKECLMVGEGVVGYKADVLTRRYQWQTSLGPVHVTCKRKWFFFGSWSCVSELGSL